MYIPKVYRYLFIVFPHPFLGTELLQMTESFYHDARFPRKYLSNGLIVVFLTFWWMLEWRNVLNSVIIIWRSGGKGSKTVGSAFSSTIHHSVGYIEPECIFDAQEKNVDIQ